MKKEVFRKIVEESNTLLGRLFDIAVQVLILLSLICFSLETLPNLSTTEKSILSNIEVCTVTIFVGEYLLRLYVSRRPLKYVFSFFGIIDILSILPFFLMRMLDLRLIRMFRFLRLFQIFKVARYSKAMKRFHRAFLISKEEIALFMLVTLMLLYLSAAGIYFFENEAQPEAFKSIFHSLWWAVCTLTTVGYGEVYPVTVGGKIFTFTILMVGLGVVAVPAGLFSSALSKAREIEE
ncbi:MAG: ion transporter [Lentisphaeraceae bacterium]|nr:ion transporter [Lentisphaeraceae bacterium]